MSDSSNGGVDGGVGSGGASPLEVVHVWRRYLVGQFNDLHAHLRERPGVESRLLAGELVDNGAPVAEGVRWVRRVPPGGYTARSLIRRVQVRALDELTWRVFLLKAPRWLPSRRPAVLHAHFGTTGAVSLPLARRSGLPLVVTFYGVDGSAVLRSPVWQRRYRKMFDVASLIIVLADAVTERLVALGCDRSKVVVWNLPGGVEHFPYREPPPVSTGARLLIAARFVEKKGYWVLLSALRRLVDEGHDVSLRAMGYGPLLPRIEERVAELGLGDRVQITDMGYRPDFNDVFNQSLDHSDIFVLPSITAPDGDDEGGPALTLVCAQAAGLPVVCTPFPGAERSVEEGVTGLYCRENDVESLVERLRWLIEHPSQWRALGRAGSERVHREFSLDTQVDELVSLYRSVAGGQER